MNRRSVLLLLATVVALVGALLVFLYVRSADSRAQAQYDTVKVLKVVQQIEPGETIDANGVTIIGPVNLPSSVPYHASQMYSKNIATFLLHLVKKGELQLNLEDEITRETLVTRDGEIVNPAVREALGMPKQEHTEKRSE